MTRANYRRIGDYIKLVDERNSDLRVDLLLGLSVDKKFIPSVANTVGTNMKNYKIIRKNQFACSTMQVRRDKKMPIAILKDFEEAIISQAYPVFQVVDESLLDPDYLMMWFSRKEFDRQATFHAVGGVRGSLEWEDFLDFTLPIPSIEKQREIVKEYNTVTNRIKLNEQINQKLEETAQALYKHWFVDFEFPNKEGKPYKSSGGKMVYNEELDKEIPEGWDVKKISDFTLKMKSGSTPNRSTNEFWSSNDHPWIKTGELKNSVLINSEEYISELALKKCPVTLLPINTVLVAMYGQGDTKGQVGYLKIPATTNQACCAMICNDEFQATFLYYHLRVNRDEIVSVAIGGAQPNLSKEIIENIKLVIPEDKVMSKHPFVKIMKHRENLTIENNALTEFRIMLLSKMSKVEEVIINN
ncbi:restriction endonuclease subunit S [Seonamhaeicola sp. NFXS20]|uniref:restriction endonuclease subunit S n=1 Tax=Seonamhaeicola sp. NFXS20 TaxID=2816959 RepID=UPI003B8C0D34